MDDLKDQNASPEMELLQHESLVERSYGLCVVMVGLPARGKSYIVKKLSRYLTWLGFEPRVFNVGDLRRTLPGYQFHDHSFFSSSDHEAHLMREELAMNVLSECLDWIGEDPQKVGFFDATNTTIERRQKVRQLCSARGVPTLFIESVCDDKKILEANIAMKLQNRDYKDVDPQIALTDFLRRVAAYEERYVPLSAEEEEEGVRYLKLYNVGKKVTMHLCTGYLPGQIGMFLSNCHIHPRTIFLSRHGQSQDNVKGLLGGDSHLTARGIAYAKALGQFIDSQELDNLTIWTSALHRTRETGKFMNLFSKRRYKIVQSRLLNEIDAGACNHMTYEMVAEKMPEEFRARESDKLRYRYPQGGESYKDLIERLKPMIIELERYHTPVLVICHQAVMRVLLAYFINCTQQHCVRLQCPLNLVVQLTPGPYQCERSDFNLDPVVRELMETEGSVFDQMVYSQDDQQNPNAGDPTQVQEMADAHAQGVGQKPTPKTQARGST
eukprot:TRINITY_DN543_c0_g1_i1.p1 TRINITY_DN543_c0_g1~~TRINITY_DN543_c0_g1_i1.p1  ORF type:complete len:496 (-),score=103.55 TRINITY_DN543_c0_g1_i1:129-1616(-)